MRKVVILSDMKTQESNLQISCVKWFKLQYPNTIIAAIPNGGKRNAITASILKQEGVLAGMPDLMICCAKNGYNGLFIEMKFGKNKLSSNQVEIIEKLRQENYKVEVCYTFDEFVKVCNEYLK